MASAIRTIGHEDRLSLVDHLEELRTRLIVSGAVLVVAFGFCLWQNHALLRIINKPLKTQTQKQVAKGEGTVGQAVARPAGGAQGRRRHTGRARRPGQAGQRPLGPGSRPAAAADRRAEGRRGQDPARTPSGDNPVTLGIGEPFTTTITVTLYFALIISLPVILYELYGFILPALKPHERRVAMPLLTAVPFLFVAGVLFGYFVVLPAAVRFFVNFNSSEFNVLVQASPYYGFVATVLLAMGLVFQVPVVIVGATRLGLVTPRQLRKGRRYAIVACAAVAAFLPGDAITLVLETVPLYLLYEVSILLASLVGRADLDRRDEGSATTAGTRHPAEDPAPPPPDDPAEPTVQDLIDHIDPRLSD